MVAVAEFSYLFNVSLFCFVFVCSVTQAANIMYDYVTCGSAIKLFNAGHNLRLHSHEVKYGSGSGQQSVTGVESSEDHNSYWTVRGRTSASCNRGEPIKCGSIIRLTHVSTNRNLHSHHYSSPITNQQEVSAFGENGEGDHGDDWKVVCDDGLWHRSDKIRLRHVITEQFLHISGDRYGRPIAGQAEVSAVLAAGAGSYWKTAEGIFIKQSENMNINVSGKTKSASEEHDEL